LWNALKRSRGVPFEMFKGVNVTINSSTAEGFVGIIDHFTRMVLTTKDRVFYDYNLLEVEKYTTNYNKKLLPPDVNAIVASFLK
jgi:hypothetical protein